MPTFHQLVTELHEGGEERFARSYATPVLYVRELEDDGEASLRFETKIVSASRTERPPGTAAVPSAAPPLREGDVLCVRKRPGAAFPDQIGVGRARNADIPVLLPRMSKYHAYFTAEPGGIWAISDARSRNGTFVNGVRLAPRVKTLLSDKDELRFAEYVFVFYGPQALLAAVKAYA